MHLCSDDAVPLLQVKSVCSNFLHLLKSFTLLIPDLVAMEPWFAGITALQGSSLDHGLLSPWCKALLVIASQDMNQSRCTL